VVPFVQSWAPFFLLSFKSRAVPPPSPFLFDLAFSPPKCPGLFPLCTVLWLCVQFAFFLHAQPSIPSPNFIISNLISLFSPPVFPLTKFLRFFPGAMKPFAQPSPTDRVIFFLRPFFSAPLLFTPVITFSIFFGVWWLVVYAGPPTFVWNPPTLPQSSCMVCPPHIVAGLPRTFFRPLPRYSQFFIF